MKILFLTYYFEPDLCAGSFRNTSLFKELISQINDGDIIDVITTHPNRYDSYKVEAKDTEHPKKNITINRIKIPLHGNGILGQIKSFKKFYFQAFKLVKEKSYDVVYASSSRLFTAFLGARIASKKEAKLYLDIRDIFKETIVDIYKKPLLQIGLNTLLTPIENYTFKKANHINLVSEGFKSYFSKYKTSYTYFTNGIDDVFINVVENKKQKKDKIILYAGNIGEGQGLHLIVPQIANELKLFTFLILGDGGAKEKLKNVLVKENITNVKILPPVKRNELIKQYEKADYLFLHLNRHKAFERVLPSKLFEYSVFNKPIIAGVSGYASVFLKENMNDVIIFEPCDIEGFKKEFYSSEKERNQNKIDRKEFFEKFSRKKINKEMSKTIILV